MLAKDYFVGENMSMAESSPIQPYFPPEHAHLAGEDERFIQEVYFPLAWMYEGNPSSAPRPFYRVHAGTEDEAQFVLGVKPAEVDLEIIFSDNVFTLKPSN